jgi:hypothetical protein
MRARSGQTTEATTDAHLEVDLGLLEQFEVLAEAVVREPRGYRSVVCHFRSTAVDKGARGGAPFGEVLFGCRHTLWRGAQAVAGKAATRNPKGADTYGIPSCLVCAAVVAAQSLRQSLQSALVCHSEWMASSTSCLSSRSCYSAPAAAMCDGSTRSVVWPGAA